MGLLSEFYIRLIIALIYLDTVEKNAAATRREEKAEDNNTNNEACVGGGRRDIIVAVGVDRAGVILFLGNHKAVEWIATAHSEIKLVSYK